MKKHIKALEERRDYLKNKLESGPQTNSDIFFLDVWVAEKEALDWALGKLEADPEPVEICMYTGRVLSRYGRAVKPIENTGHFGPIREGAVVQAKTDVAYAEIYAGEIGKLTHFDSWAGEEYPYIASFEGGRKAAFAREDIRRVD